MIAHSVSRRAKPRLGLKASSSARLTKAAAGTPARRHEGAVAAGRDDVGGVDIGRSLRPVSGHPGRASRRVEPKRAAGCEPSLCWISERKASMAGRGRNGVYRKRKKVVSRRRNALSVPLLPGPRGTRSRNGASYIPSTRAPPVSPAPAAASNSFSPGRNGRAAWATDSDNGMVAADELP
jgi:hypothetical protein